MAPGSGGASSAAGAGYLGRPSAGDSPFAIGQKAYFDTTSPQAPSQRNPTPRGQPAMATPQPYGNVDVSGEARRRYEERKKKMQEEERQKSGTGGGGQGGGQGAEQGQGQGQGQGGQGGYQGGSASQGGSGGGYPGGSGIQHYQQPPQQHRPPPAQHQSYGPSPVLPGAYPHSPQPQFNPHSPQPPFGAQPPPPQWAGYSSTSPQPQQSPHSSHGSLQPQNQPSRSSFDQTRPGQFAQPQGQQLYDRPVQSPPIQQGQQRWSGQSGQHPQPPQQQQQQQQQHQSQGGPQWSQKAAPPPPQDFRGRPGSAQSHNTGQGQGGHMGQAPSNQGHSQVASVHVGDQGDEELRMMFEQFDSSRSGQLHSFDLQRLLAKDSLMEDPREDAVKMLMNIFDTDRSGSINFMEFEGLYRYIQDWHGIFQRFDRDASGLIDRKELHQALLGFGFSLPAEMVRKLEKRFAPPPKLLPGGQVVPRKGISFDRFLMACVTVKHYTEGFRKLDPNNTGQITVDYNSFMEMVLDAP